MLKLAVVEDDPKTSSEITALCERFFAEKEREFDVQTFFDGASFISSFRSDYDIVLLDIDMPLMNGLAAAKKIRETDDRCAIIFMTNLTQFVLKGYEVAASGYLVKPVLYEKFRRAMNQALKYIDKSQKKTIILRIESDVYVLNVDDIRYIEVMGHNLSVHTENKTYTLKKTLTEFERSLEGFGFARPNHSYLVNLKYVRSVVKNDVILNVGSADVKLVLSRNKKKAFIDALIAYSR